jgi:hypothetical protein
MLENRIEAHPNLNFTVIINPASGPGETQYPNANYTTQITRLNSYQNVQTVGYVRTGYATNNLTDVITQVETYGGWSNKSVSLAMHGIFCDEAPHQFSEDAAQYMRTLNNAIKSTSGLLGNRLVIHNPGVVPDPVFYDANTDVTVVFEENYDLWDVRESAIADNPSNSSLMVHSLPDLSEGELEGFVGELAKKAEYLFLTSNTADYYESFGSDWANFTDAGAAA